MLEWGFSVREVATELGLPQSTVSRWRVGKTPCFGPTVALAPWRPPHPSSYAYLLGVYLGDGHVTVRPAGRCWLRVFLDGAYRAPAEPSGRVAEYAYPRYFFSNLSEDIRGLFCWACELLDIRWTQSNPRNISVSHRASVAILEELVGPKT